MTEPDVETKIPVIAVTDGVQDKSLHGFFSDMKTYGA
jgi:hypothetical protein